MTVIRELKGVSNNVNIIHRKLCICIETQLHRPSHRYTSPCGGLFFEFESYHRSNQLLGLEGFVFHLTLAQLGWNYILSRRHFNFSTNRYNLPCIKSINSSPPSFDTSILTPLCTSCNLASNYCYISYPNAA